MKNQINDIVKTILILAVIGLQSCKKTDDSIITPTPTPTPTFSLVGTWSLIGADVTVNGKSYTVTAADIAKTSPTKGSYNAEDIVFTADGKYTRGKEAGTWTLATSAQLKLKNAATDLTYEFANNDATTMQFGNTWDLIKDPTPTLVQADAPSTSQAILNGIDVGLPGASLASVKYRVNYKKKV
jgi:C-terminal lipocalin-like domain